MKSGFTLSTVLLCCFLMSVRSSPLEEQLLEALEQRIEQRNKIALFEKLADKLEGTLDERANDNKDNDAFDDDNLERDESVSEDADGRRSYTGEVAGPGNGERQHNNANLENLGEIFDFAALDERMASDLRQDTKLPTVELAKPLLPVLPKPGPATCCVRGSTYVDLTSGKITNNANIGVTVVSKPAKQSKFSDDCCDLSAVLKINFEKITKEPCELVDGCLPGPFCGRRMLRIDLKLSPTQRDDWMFNIGDSQSNNGHKGDGNHQMNDAEIDGLHPNIKVHSSDLCNSNASLNTLAVYSNALATATNYVTIYVSDKHARITNDNGLDETLCHRCLYALNGQADSSIGGVNEDIFLGLNRVVAGGRYGIGVCAARLSWMCPWC